MPKPGDKGWGKVRVQVVVNPKVWNLGYGNQLRHQCQTGPIGCLQQL